MSHATSTRSRAKAPLVASTAEALARMAASPVSLGAAAAAAPPATRTTPKVAVLSTAEALARLATTPPVALGAACTPTGSLGAPVGKGPRATGAHDFTAPATFYVNRFQDG